MGSHCNPKDHVFCGFPQERQRTWDDLIIKVAWGCGDGPGLGGRLTHPLCYCSAPAVLQRSLRLEHVQAGNWIPGTYSTTFGLSAPIWPLELHLSVQFSSVIDCPLHPRKACREFSLKKYPDEKSLRNTYIPDSGDKGLMNWADKVVLDFKRGGRGPFHSRMLLEGF